MSTNQQKGKDPGWNDPPTFAYDQATAIQTNAAKKGSLLNKRISFPMSTTTKPTTNNFNDPTAPISSTKCPPPPLGSGNVNKPPMTDTNISNEQTEEVHLEEVLGNFNTIFAVNEDSSVSQRLKILENMWQTNQLHQEVKIKLMDLSKALLEGNVDQADHIQKSLMVDYVGQCSTWMGGIRQIINSKR